MLAHRNLILLFSLGIFAFIQFLIPKEKGENNFHSNSSLTVISKNDSALNHYEAVKMALQDCYIALPASTKGEWQDVYKEKYQSFEAYLKSKPIQPDKIRNKIYIQPIGKFDSLDTKIILIAADYLHAFFSLEVKINHTIPDTLVPEKSRRKLNGTEQLHTEFIMNSLLKPSLPADAASMIAITEYDLYPKETWNYVFGQASVKERIGVWSLNRFGNPNLSTYSLHSCLMRTLQTASHETGHMFSLPHCVKYKCLMNGSISLEESDNKPLWLCPDCLCKLCWNLGIREKFFLSSQKIFWEKSGDKTLAEFYGKCLKQIVN